MRPVITSTPLVYALENILFYKYIPVVILFLLPAHYGHNNMNNNLLSQICYHHYVYTYIQCGHI